jgi:N-acetylneuraminic acid mutarotase
MKKLFTLLSLSLSLSFSLVKADFWTQKASFPGTNRIGCFSFTIGSKGYWGCGYDTNWTPTRTFWEYDKQFNTWTQKATFPDSARVYATGFSILNKGYAGLGVSPAMGWMEDFWEYDPATNAWSPIADFGGGQRSEACSFVVNNKAYVGTGTGVVAPYTFNDLWEYDPLTNIWTPKASLPGAARIKALGFTAGAYGYIVTGYAATNYFSDLWEYNPVTDSWLQKMNFTGDPRGGAAGVTLYNKIYLGTGNNQPATGSAYASKDWWKYDPLLNQWTPKNSFAGAPRYETGYFAIDNKGFVGIGVKANIQYSDFWEYTGDPLGVEQIPINNLQFTISPNPANEFIVIRYALAEKENIEICITNARGEKVYLQKPGSRFPAPETKINISKFSQGIYFVDLSNGVEKAVKKFLKE